MKLFVANLSWNVKVDVLQQEFECYGEVEDVTIILDRETSRSRGFGFVTYANADSAKKAIVEMNGKEIDGRKIIVNEAKERTKRDTPRRDFRNKEW